MDGKDLMAKRKSGEHVTSTRETPVLTRNTLILSSFLSVCRILHLADISAPRLGSAAREDEVSVTLLSSPSLSFPFSMKKGRWRNIMNVD